jgi:hypothetical protein
MYYKNIFLFTNSISNMRKTGKTKKTVKKLKRNNKSKKRMRNNKKKMHL